MKPTQKQVDKAWILPAALTAGSNVTANIDCIGSDYATVRCIVSNIAGTGVASASGTTISLLSSDNTNASTFATLLADVTGVKFGREIRYEVDLHGKKRYLRSNITAGSAGVSNDAVVVTMVATLSKREDGVTSYTALAVGGTNDAVYYI